MPHVIVKLLKGRSKEQLSQLTLAIADQVRHVLDVPDGDISVAFEEFPADEWMEGVYEPDIAGRLPTVTKLPGYGPLG